MAIVRHIKTNVLYRYLGKNVFQNLVTLAVGTVEDEKAREVFRINLEATEILNEYPLVEKMINSLKLKFDNN